MTRLEKDKAIMKFVISCNYKEDDFNLFKAEYGWADWMNEHTDSDEGESITESESREIDKILEEGFKMAFDEQWREICELNK